MHCFADHEQNSLSMGGSNEEVHEIFSDEFLQIPLQHASSTSSLGSESSTSDRPQFYASTPDLPQLSSSTTPDETQQLFSTSYAAEQSYSISNVTHDPFSTSHVTQQCYSISGGTQQFSSTTTQAHQSSVTNETQPSTSNMAQQSSSHDSVVQTLSPNTSDCHMWISSDSFFCEDFTGSDASCWNDNAAEYPELAPNQSPSCLSVLQTANSEVWTASELEEEETQMSASSSPCRLSENMRSFVSSSYSSDPVVNSEAATLRVKDIPKRQHWVQFEGGPTKQCTPQVTAPLEIVPSAPPPDTESSSGETPLQTPAPASASNLAMREKPRSSPTHYSGRLIRTYSQRGRRASKRVINSVSRRMSTPDYGRLPEPQPPMYSRAVMTMQTGPGLFNNTLESRDSECPREEEKQCQPPMSSLDKPVAHCRVGSIRAPLVSTTHLRRSLSLNAPREESSGVPFQKLSEQRPGSFRRALGALTRSFRRKSSITNTPDLATNENNSVTHREQTPQAPRLPRRAARHSYPSTQDWERPAQYV